MKQLLGNKAWSLALAIGLALGMAQAAGAQTQTGPSDPVAVVDAFHAAGDDMDAALAILADEVVIELRPAPPNTPGIWKGKAEARGFFEWRNANGQRRERLGNPIVEGNNITGLVNTSSNVFRSLGLDAVEHSFQAVVEDGKLKSYLGQITPLGLEKLNAARVAAGQASAPPAGMPRTGAPLLLPIILTIGMALVTAGAALRRRKA